MKLSREDCKLCLALLFGVLSILSISEIPIDWLWIVIGVFTVLFLVGLVLVVRDVRRPLDEFDAHCSRVDVELDRERMVRRLERQAARRAR